MSDAYNVFISWSGQRSKWVADALREWLPIILQASRPWMSGTDIEKGSRGLDELGRALEGIKLGIICLTPENLEAPWILFEAGALSKTIDAKTRLCTYLLPGLEPQDVKPPLAQFQWTKAEKEDTRKLVIAINKALDAVPVPESNLGALFEGMWPRLEEKLARTPGPEEIVESKRPVEEMVVEILELSRDEANRRKATERFDSWIPIMDRLMPLLDDLAKKTRTTVPLSSLRGYLVPSLATTSRKVFFVKLEYDDEVKRIEGTDGEEDQGRLVIRDAGKVVARFGDNVERWWTEPAEMPTDENLRVGPPPGAAL